MDTDTALALLTPDSLVILIGVGIVKVISGAACPNTTKATKGRIIASFVMSSKDGSTETGYLVDMDRHGVLTVTATITE